MALSPVRSATFWIPMPVLSIDCLLFFVHTITLTKPCFVGRWATARPAPGKHDHRLLSQRPVHTDKASHSLYHNLHYMSSRFINPKMHIYRSDACETAKHHIQRLTVVPGALPFSSRFPHTSTHALEPASSRPLASYRTAFMTLPLLWVRLCRYNTLPSVAIKVLKLPDLSPLRAAMRSPSRLFHVKLCTLRPKISVISIFFVRR